SKQDFDITKPQPQLYVTPDFAHLSSVLEEFANKMALRRGGLSGVRKLIESKNIGTVELSTGLQISGDFSRVIEFEGKPVFIQTTGKTALSHREKELVGHGASNHADGFGSPIGSLKGINLAIEDMSPRDLRAYDIYEGEKIELEFEGGIKVSGEIITGTRNLQGKIILISFKNCTVTHGEEFLFKPEWGKFDMAVGKEVISAFAGPADAKSFDLITHTPSSTTIKSKKSPERQELEELYASVRNIRDGKNAKFSLQAVLDLLVKHHQNDWLLSIEIYEITAGKDEALAKEALQNLEKVKIRRPDISHLIEGGLELIDEKLVTG
ncbi:MAG TPA: aromatic amino acid hydroxylase, partial [Salegentibacter sp.]|nr:aromatic amino acid hydroxylase [Salegentibacter sp.]